MFLKKLEIELPYDPAIPLLGIYLEKTKTLRDVHFSVHSSIIYNSQDMEATGECIKKMWYKYIYLYIYRYIRCIELECIMLSEVSQIKANTIYFYLYVEFEKNKTNEQI